jgi:hypothetical protein
MEPKLEMRRRGCIAAWFVLVGLGLITAPAWAAPKRKPAHRAAEHKAPESESPERVEAQRHYASGVELLERGEYRSAVVEFELVSMDLPNRTPVDYQIARCLERTGQLRDALNHYRSFVAAAPADPKSPEARRRIDELAPEVARAEQEARARAPEPAPEPKRRREPPPEQASSRAEAPVSAPQSQDSVPAHSAPVTPARQYILGLSQGFSAPIESSHYTNDFDSSYVAGLSFGVAFRLTDSVLLGPVVRVDGLPLNSSSTSFPVGTANAKLGEVRGVGGVELRLPTNYFELWVRAMVGVDAILGSIKYTDAATKAVTHGHVSSRVLGFVPQLGWSVPVASRVSLGLSLGLPFARDQHVGKGNSPANELDFELAAVLEVRL